MSFAQRTRKLRTLSLPRLSPSVRKFTCLNSKTAERILIKSDTNVRPMLPDDEPQSYALISCNLQQQQRQQQQQQ
jgi:hypothetical protein